MMAAEMVDMAAGVAEKGLRKIGARFFNAVVRMSRREIIMLMVQDHTLLTSQSPTTYMRRTLALVILPSQGRCYYNYHNTTNEGHRVARAAAAGQDATRSKCRTPQKKTGYHSGDCQSNNTQFVLTRLRVIIDFHYDRNCTYVDAGKGSRPMTQESH